MFIGTIYRFAGTDTFFMIIHVYTLSASIVYLQGFHRYDCTLDSPGQRGANGEAVSGPGLSQD